MSIENIQILLTASSNQALKGRLLKSVNSVNKFGFKTNKSKSAYQAEHIVFINENLSKFSGEEPFEQLGTFINTKLIEASYWLNDIDKSVFDILRNDNIQIQIIVSAWINEDQFDLELPSEFLLACGNQGLSIIVVTND